LKAEGTGTQHQGFFQGLPEIGRDFPMRIEPLGGVTPLQGLDEFCRVELRHGNLEKLVSSMISLGKQHPSHGSR
jgi:hypothetical protein